MNASRVTVAALACVVAFAALVRGQTKADPREKLDTAIPEAIRLLEAKKYETFLQKYVVPDQLKEIIKAVSLEEFAQSFGRNKAPALLRVLKAVKGKKPSLDKEGKKATFKHGVKGVPYDSITFVKVDKFWYMRH